MQMPSQTPAFGRATIGLVALDSPTWALRRGTGLARGRSARGDRSRRLQCDGERGAGRGDDRLERRRRRRLDSRVRSPRDRGGARAVVPGRRGRLGALRRRAGEVAARLDERLRPRRPAHRSVARRDRARERRRRDPDGLDGVDVLGRGADARRLADWLAAGVKVPVWVVGDLPGIQGVRMRFGSHERVIPPPAVAPQRLARRRTRPGRLRARADAGAAGLGGAQPPHRLTPHSI